MSVPKRHHFISQFYLKAFASVEGATDESKYFLNVIDLKEASDFRNNIEDVAVKRHFNRMTIDGQHIQDLEKNLSIAEGKISTVFEKMRDSRSFSDEDLSGAISLMSLFACRTPTRRDQLDTLMIDLQEHLYQFLANSEEAWEGRDDGLTREMYLEAFNKGSIKPVPSTKEGLIQDELTMVQHLIPLLSRRHWTLLDAANTGENFLISDCPVNLFYRDRSKGPIGGIWDAVGFGTAGTIVNFPISSSLSLFGTLEPEDAPEVNSSLVVSLNGHSIGCADRFVYFNDDGFTATDHDGKKYDQKEVLAWFEQDKKLRG